MGYGGDSGFAYGNVVQIVTGGSGSGGGNSILGSSDQAVWAADEEYQALNGNRSFESPANLSLSGEGPSKKLRVSEAAELQNSRAKAIGKMFFKTKLCCNFRVGICPYMTNCHFAHGLEELRKPPPNWQEIVEAQDGEKKVVEPREEFKIPSVVSTGFNGDGSRSSKGRHCKKFNTEEGCPYGDSCAYTHDQLSRARESVAITLNTVPLPSANSYVVVADGGGGVQHMKPAHWKTKLCNKWETTGFCPFGTKCLFAHGVAELTHISGVSAATEAKGSNFVEAGTVPSKPQGDHIVASTTYFSHSDMYETGISSQRPSCAIQGLAHRIHQKWKGPDKISRIYGDWIDDMD